MRATTKEMFSAALSPEQGCYKPSGTTKRTQVTFSEFKHSNKVISHFQDIEGKSRAPSQEQGQAHLRPNWLWSQKEPDVLAFHFLAPPILRNLWVLPIHLFLSTQQSVLILLSEWFTLHLPRFV